MVAVADLNQLEGRVRDLRDAVARDEGRQGVILEQLQEQTVRRDSARETAELALNTRLLLEKLTDSKREVVRDRIESLVTFGIRAVFGAEYTFRIVQGTARNNVTFNYRVTRDMGGEVDLDTDLRGSHGGGLVALVGFLLRVVMVLFVTPSRRRIILLDETMAALDGDKRAPFAQLMRQLGEKLDLQFLLVTHSEEYVEDADKAYTIKSSGGRARFASLT